MRDGYVAEVPDRHRLISEAELAALRAPGTEVTVAGLRLPKTMRNYVLAGLRADLTVVAQPSRGRGLGQRVQFRYRGEVVSPTVADVLLTLSELAE